jgi:hypothetical protein
LVVWLFNGFKFLIWRFQRFRSSLSVFPISDFDFVISAFALICPRGTLSTQRRKGAKVFEIPTSGPCSPISDFRF